MNNDLISRSALKENRPEFLNPNQRGHIQYNSGWNSAISYFLSLIDNAPTVDKCSNCDLMLREKTKRYDK